MHGYFLNSGPNSENKNQNFPIHFLKDKMGFQSDKESFIARQESSFVCIDGAITAFLDSEVQFDQKNILNSLNQLYQSYPEDFVKKIDGLFIIFFQPMCTEKVYIINNRYEANRLYYFLDTNKFYFSKSLNRLLKYFSIEKKVNVSSLRSFLANGFTSSEQTQIEGVRKMLPADYFIINQLGVLRKSYWDGEITFKRRKFDNLESHLDTYESLYQKGIENYLTAKSAKSVGTLLSGGHDTSFVVAQAVQVLHKLKLPQLKTYTVTFPDWTFNEEETARNIAEKFGANFNAIPFKADNLDSILDLIKANEEPVVGSSLPLHVLMEQASKDVDVIFGGDGGDTLWGEYYPVAEYHKLTKLLPQFFRRAIHKLSSILKKITDWERFWELDHVAKLFIETDYHDRFLQKLCTYRHFDDEFQKKILVPEIYSVPYSRSHTEIKYTDDNFPDALIESKLYNGFYPYQSFHTGKSARHFSMDLYLPTINKKVIDLITQLPMKWVNGGNFIQRLSNDKVINRVFHKKALSRYLNKNEIYNRSFDIPWYKILLPRSELMTVLLKKLKSRGWYQENYLDQLFQEFSDQSVKSYELLELKNHGYRIFTLLSLEVWYQMFIDGKEYDKSKHQSLEKYLE
jgi:asparagine synthase (glutamine-hydrolysing)